MSHLMADTRDASCWDRPYDMLADARRRIWQPRTPCRYIVLPRKRDDRQAGGDRG